MALLDNLIAYWRLDESSGNRLDSVGSATLTDNNSTGSAAGKIGLAADFELTNSNYLTKTDTAALSTGTAQDFTLQAWVNLESKATTQFILGRWGGAGNYEYALLYDQPTDRFVFFINTDGTSGFFSAVANTLGSPSTGTWYLLHAGYNTTTDRVFIGVNGSATLDLTATATGAFDSASNFTIGRNDDGGVQYFDGLIDEVGFWKRILTDAERSLLYGGGSGYAFGNFEPGEWIVPKRPIPEPFILPYEERRRSVVYFPAASWAVGDADWLRRMPDPWPYPPPYRPPEPYRPAFLFPVGNNTGEFDWVFGRTDALPPPVPPDPPQKFRREYPPGLFDATPSPPGTRSLRNIPLIERNPHGDLRRLERIADKVASRLNALVRKGQLRQTDIDEWRLYGAAVEVARPPVATDDATGGYFPGIQWVDTAAQRVYVCVVNTAGAAVWKAITS